jgi:hypothetical protein
VHKYYPFVNCFISFCDIATVSKVFRFDAKESRVECRVGDEMTAIRHVHEKLGQDIDWKLKFV